MEWIKEMDYKKHFDGDLLILLEIIGIDKLIKIYEVFGKTSIYFSEKPIMQMKREYIKRHFGLINDRELARKLGVSQRLIYKIAKEKVSNINQGKLFDD